MKKTRIAIIGAGGRDFHNFLVKYKNNPNYEVKFFTAAQIPGIEKRSFPKELAGKNYKKNIPILPEKDLARLIKKHEIDECVFSYSDVSHEEVMHKASVVNAAGANFTLLGSEDTMIKSKKKIISVCAVRTGSGKSQVSRKIAIELKKANKKVVAIRHPMPYGNLKDQEVQKFTTLQDLKKHKTTIEEREEYEPWITLGIPIFAGVNYQKILLEAEAEADIIIWDGGNNDLPFYKPNTHFVVVDPHRPGHELKYHPGETNLRMADVIIINKIRTAPKEGIRTVEENVKAHNPKATIIRTESAIITDKKIPKSSRALVVEDGPTLTHGGMTYGAGMIAAKEAGAKIIKPEKYAVGSIKKTFKKYPQAKNVLPAMGYGKSQMKELEKTINRTPSDLVIIGTPINLAKLIKINKPTVRVEYFIKEKSLTIKSALQKKRYL